MISLMLALQLAGAVWEQIPELPLFTYERFIPEPVIWAEEPAVDRTLHFTDALEALYGEAGSVRLFRVDVPEEVALWTLQLSGGQGDADLYLRYGEPPSLWEFDHRPFVRGNNEHILVREPAPGSWYLMIHGATEYEGAALALHARSETPFDDDPAQASSADVELSIYYELSGHDIGIEPWNLELRNRLLREEGRIAFNRGEYDTAIRIWERWAAQDPLNPEPISLIGDVYLRMEELEQAVTYYERSLDLQPAQVALALRLARLLDMEMEQKEEARIWLNRYTRLFPMHPDVALGRAEWLIRRKRYDEAEQLMLRVIEEHPDHLRARTLIHGLLRSPEQRFSNMRNIVELGKNPGMEYPLAHAIRDNQLLTRPEAWILMDYIEQLSVEAPTESLRNRFQELLPRDAVSNEDLRLGRLSRNWISSHEQLWSEEGSLLLSADPSQTEAFLRLDRSDAMANAFIEAEIDRTRGFCWLYARRGEGNMIRFGFDDTGLLYQQIWMNGHLIANETRLWSRPDEPVTLRLEVRADGIFSLLNDEPAFAAPLSIPADMGMGWWGVAPWSPIPGEAVVEIRRVAGGPLPTCIGLIRPPPTEGRSPERLDVLQQRVQQMSLVAPHWYVQRIHGGVGRRGVDDIELRLLTRYYRARLMPVLLYWHLDRLDWAELIRLANADRVDGFTLLVDKMPDPQWILEVEEKLLPAGINVLLVMVEPGGRKAMVREIAPFVGLFPGARRPHRLNLYRPDVHPVEEMADQRVVIF